MQQNCAHVLGLILANEGGWSDHPRDPGGPTMMGVTLKTLEAWRKRPVTVDELRAIDRTEAEAIFRAQYMTPVAFDQMPAGLDYCLADTAVNSGPARAVELLQGVLGVQRDGIVGAQTLAALVGHSVPELINAYSEARLAFLRTLATWSTFGRGWASRVALVEHEALEIATGADYANKPGLQDGADAKAMGATKVTASFNGKAAIGAVIGTLGAAGTAAQQASDVLQPYAGVRMIHWALVGLAVASALGTLAVAFRRAGKGVPA